MVNWGRHERVMQEFWKLGAPSPDDQLGPYVPGRDESQYWRDLRNNPNVFDEYGSTTSLPGYHIAPEMQHQANMIARERNDRLMRDAGVTGQGFLQSALGNMQTYRPGGAAAMTSGIYGQQAQTAFNTGLARQQDAPDLMFRYDEKVRKSAEADAKKAGMLSAIGTGLGAAIGAFGGPLGSMIGAQLGGTVGYGLSGGAAPPGNVNPPGGVGTAGSMGDGSGFAPIGGGQPANVPMGGGASYAPGSAGYTMGLAGAGVGAPPYQPQAASAGTGGGAAPGGAPGAPGAPGAAGAPGGGGPSGGGGGGAPAGGGASMMGGTPPSGPMHANLSQALMVDPGLVAQVLTEGESVDYVKRFDMRLRMLEEKSNPAPGFMQSPEWNAYSPRPQSLAGSPPTLQEAPPRMPLEMQVQRSLSMTPFDELTNERWRPRQALSVRDQGPGSPRDRGIPPPPSMNQPADGPTAPDTSLAAAAREAKREGIKSTPGLNPGQWMDPDFKALAKRYGVDPGKLRKYMQGR